MSFPFSKLSRCLLHFSFVVLEGPYRRAVDGDACNPLVDEAYAPADMNFSTIRSIRIYSTNFSTALHSLDMHAREQIFRVGEQTLKVAKWVAKSQ
jgi:hypothetical protein